jgi:hypothetical protein
MKAVSNSRNQKSNTSRKADEARVNARTKEEHLDAVDNLDLSKFTDREKAIVSRASAFLDPLNYRYFVRSARRDIDPANSTLAVELDPDLLSRANKEARRRHVTLDELVESAIRNFKECGQEVAHA